MGHWIRSKRLGFDLAEERERGHAETVPTARFAMVAPLLAHQSFGFRPTTLGSTKKMPRDGGSNDGPTGPKNTEREATKMVRRSVVSDSCGDARARHGYSLRG